VKVTRSGRTEGPSHHEAPHKLSKGLKRGIDKIEKVMERIDLQIKERPHKKFKFSDKAPDQNQRAG
jgi:hypothetical protein